MRNQDVRSRFPEARRIRRESFRKRIPLNRTLLNLLEGEHGHDFLKNPAGQNVYLYLVDFVKSFSEFWFRADIGNLRILDWGCGKGQVSFLLREVGAYPVSCDLMRDVSDSAFGPNTPIIDRVGIEVVPLTRQYLLPFEDDDFDVVLSFGVLEHVSNDLESLKEIRRVLKPSGLFFCFNLPYSCSWTQKIAHRMGNFYHGRLYNWENAKDLLDKSGLAILDGWHRQFLPKNTLKYPAYRLLERVDQLLVDWTFLKRFATNIEFVARNEHGWRPHE